MKTISEHRCFEGRQLRVRHHSDVCQCEMTFSLFLPPQAQDHNIPVLTWLSGLTCTDENVIQKSGIQRYAAKHGVAIIAPDTSPRGNEVPDDENAQWDFGLGAGFYLNATQSPWSHHYQMYDYITRELPALLEKYHVLDLDRQAISGHSMGGHGALTIALRQPKNYHSVSAFAPICAPMQCSWGIKAFTHYLGANRAGWEKCDASCLVGKASSHLPILIDQGTEDPFLQEQLKPELFRKAAEQAGYPVTFRMQSGYDHSYFFISSFIGEHVAFHAKYLKG